MFYSPAAKALGGRALSYSAYLQLDKQMKENLNDLREFKSSEVQVDIYIGGHSNTLNQISNVLLTLFARFVDMITIWNYSPPNNYQKRWQVPLLHCQRLFIFKYL